MPTFSEQLGERTYVSQYAIEDVGLAIHHSGVLEDADGNDVSVRLDSLDGTTVVFERAATHDATGLYSATLSSVDTATQGLWRLTWSYDLDTIPQTFVTLIEIGAPHAAYDNLDPGFQGIIENVWARFADLFDSPNGGPHLQVYFQTRFNRGRMAGLLQTAVNRLNTIAQPQTTYSLDTQAHPFPFAQWGGLLDQALYVEAIKHLIRSYVEQPDVQGTVAIARLDRRDYMQRWQSVLEMEQGDLDSMLDTFKIAHMGLGRPHVLVSGGVYGNYGPTRLPLSAAARPRYHQSFHI